MHTAEGCLQVRCLAMENPLSIIGQEFFFEGTCLPSCSLATDIHVTILISTKSFLSFYFIYDVHHYSEEFISMHSVTVESLLLSAVPQIQY
jgi:hypothetical protein